MRRSGEPPPIARYPALHFGARSDVITCTMSRPSLISRQVLIAAHSVITKKEEIECGS